MLSQCKCHQSHRLLLEYCSSRRQCQWQGLTHGEPILSALLTGIRGLKAGSGAPALSGPRGDVALALSVCSHRIAVGSLGDWWHSHLNNRCFGELAQITLLGAHTGEQQMPSVLQPRCGVALEHGSTPRAVWLCWGTGAGGAPWGHVPHAQVAKFQLCVCHELCGAGIGVCAPFLTTTKISRKPTHFHCFQSEGPVHILDHECSLSMGLLHAAAQVSHSQLTVHLL